MEFYELLHVDHKGTLQFFYNNLKERTLSEKVEDDETLHVASVLASYSQSSFSESSSLPPPANLSDVFDLFVARSEVLSDPELLTTAGAQTLFMAGFFREQMRRRHNLSWYDSMGRDFYYRAGLLTLTPRRHTMLTHMSANFPKWTHICRDLHRELQDKRYLLRLQ